MSAGSSVVYVVDDDPAVRDSIQALLRSAGFAVEVFDSAQKFLDYTEGADPGRPSCLVLDLQLPDLNGLELQRRLQKLELTMPVIFVSGHGDIPTTVRAMKAGAVEFLTKPISPEELLAGVEGALALDAASRQQTADDRELRDRYARLKPREREVMERVAVGMLNKQIADALGLSESTVKLYRHGVMEKMGADTLADLVRMAGRLGIS